MRRSNLAVAFVAAAVTLPFSAAGAQAKLNPLIPPNPVAHPHGCHRLYTVAQAKRAAKRIYSGKRHVTTRERHWLGWLVRCQRHPANRPRVRRLEHKQREAWLARRRPWHGPVVASWFYDAGAIACAHHATYGFATLLPIACGAHIQMRGPNGRIVTATREDSGPYVSGRAFDLNPALRDALGCGGLCDVFWR